MARVGGHAIRAGPTSRKPTCSAGPARIARLTAGA